ncbi:MAG: endonuclease/exonuclease/phosphatase family protein [Bacteroidota bacterium]
MRQILVISILLLVLKINIQAQKSAGNQFKIAFYNTENLFDTIDDTHKSDEDFLPTSKVAWNSERYFLKLKNIARALISIDSTNLPAVIGLAEVENIAVVNDLISKTLLDKGNWGVILEEGSDPRGIDVAMLYRKDVMKYIGHSAFSSAASFKSRSVLYVRLADAKKDTFHLFVNHWKSRSGGAPETEYQRVENATTLKSIIDSVLSRNSNAKIVIMGDFNDEPNNKSLSEVLGAGKPDKKIASTGLYNLFYELFMKGEGTIYYKDWDMFDQIIVSGNLLIKKRKGTFILPPYGYIFKPDWILYKNKKGEMVPNRTAGTKEYFGGFSDHLPVYTIINY